MPVRPRERFLERLPAPGLLTTAVLAPLTLLLVAEAVASLRWRMVHDTPLLHYAAWQISELGRVPYAGVMETSMPGSLLFHIAIGETLGWGDFAFQCADLLWLSAVLALTWRILSRLGRQVAWAGLVLFGLAWFSNGPAMVLQRDGAAVLPIAAAICLATEPWTRRSLQAVLAGALFGLAATIKPQLAIGLPVVVLHSWALGRRPNRPPWSEAARRLGLAGAGLLLPVAACLLWVAARGGLPAFVEMATDYLPLHLRLNGRHEALEGVAVLTNIARGLTKLGGHGLWLAPLVLVALRAADHRLDLERRMLCGLLLSLTLAYGLVPAFAGQFWRYHWLPFQYFAAITSAVIVLPVPDRGGSPLRRALPAALLGALVLLAIRPAPGFIGTLRGTPLDPPKDGRVDEVAAFLQERIEPGEAVQALDWTGGAVHAMFVARVPAATRFICDYHFYHHVSQPVVQRWRQELLTRLATDAPPFVIRFDGVRATGPDTEAVWADLESFLAEHYEPVRTGERYVILERSLLSPAPPEAELQDGEGLPPRPDEP